MNFLRNRIETAIGIERTPHRIRLEHSHDELAAVFPGLVHQLSSNAPSLVTRMNENRSYFTSKQGHKTNDSSFILENPCLGIWKVQIGDVLTVHSKKLLRQKRVRNLGCRCPRIQQIVQIVI